MASWHFNPEIDTAKSYALFQVYLESNSLEDAYEAHYKRVLGGKKRKVPGNVSQWAYKANWVKRKEDYHISCQQKTLEKVRQSKIEEQKNELEQYRQSARMLGKTGVKNLLALENLIKDGLYESNGQTLAPKKIDQVNLKEIRDLISSSQAQAAKNPLDAWAKALQIDKMQAQLQQMQEVMSGQSE